LPRDGEVYDIFVESWREVIERSFYDHRTAPEYLRIYGENYIPPFGGIREAGRVMNTILAYRPFMYDPALPGILAKIRVPSLVVLGDTDRIMPRECGERFQQGISGATLTTLDRCGHWAHLDRPEALTETIRAFVTR
jgi:pimeloyl-ACP methyl ester carboxylesterase